MKRKYVKVKYKCSGTPAIALFFVAVIVGCSSTRFSASDRPQPPPEIAPSREESVEILQRSLLEAEVLEAQINQKEYELDVLIDQQKRCTSDCEQIAQRMAALNKEVLVLEERVDSFTKEGKKQLCIINPQRC